MSEVNSSVYLNKADSVNKKAPNVGTEEQR